MALTKIDDRGLKTPIDLLDNEKIRFGTTDNDLEIFHDSNNSYIKDTGTGALVLATSKLSVNNAASNQELIVAYQGGSVELFHANTKKFETTSDGVSVTGKIQMTDHSSGTTGMIILGADGDIKLFHNNSNAILQTNTGELRVLAGNDNGIIVKPDNAVELYWDGSKKFETSATGATLTGTLVADGLTVDTNTLHVDASNNRVGIGTTSPDAPLTIHNSSDPEIRFGYSGSQDHRITWDSSKVVIHADPDNQNNNSAVSIAVDGTTALTLDDSQNASFAGSLTVNDGTPNITVYAETDGEDATLSLVGKTATGGVGQAGIVRIIGDSTATANGSSQMKLQTRNSSNAIITALTLDNDQNATFAKQIKVSAGYGLHFGANSDTGRTVSSNVLDDYEEGAWTATVEFGNNSTGIAYSNRTGRYTKIGRLVHASFVIGLTNKGSGTGNCEISGLPFTATNDSDDRINGTLSLYGAMSGINSNIMCYNTTNATFFYLYDGSSTTNTILTHDNWTNTSHIRGFVIYHCA